MTNLLVLIRLRLLTRRIRSILRLLRHLRLLLIRVPIRGLRVYEVIPGKILLGEANDLNI